MTNLKLKVSKASYEEKLNKLKELANKIDHKISVFEQYKRQTSKFIDENDDNYENVMNNIDTNIASCRKSHERIEETIKFVQATLNDMMDVVNYGKQILVDNESIAKDAVATAVDVVTGSLGTILK